MTPKALRKWSWVHKWSSVICTLFMLMLCITGLPLIFHEEINGLLHEEVAAATVPTGTRPADLDRVVASAVAPIRTTTASSASEPIPRLISTRPMPLGASPPSCSSCTTTCSPACPGSCFSG